MNILKWHGLDIDPMKISESITTKVEIGQVDTAFNESTNESGITVLYPKIEAIHEGRTRNFNRYTAEKLKGNHELKSGVYSWTQPYPKPVIHNHDINTEATGRVYSASYSEYTSAGRPGIIVTPKITQEKAIKDILEGRLLTVSIGASTNAAVCTICGTDIINEGFCGHMRGEEYDGQVAEWVAGDLFFDELSWVNVPADSDAMIMNNGLTNNMITTGEGMTNNNAGNIVSGTLNMEDLAGNTVTSNTKLTPDSELVTSVSESTEKEESIVTKEETIVDPATEDKPVVEDQATQQDKEPVVDETTVKESSTKTEDGEVIPEPVVDKSTVNPEPVATQDNSDELKAVQDELKEAQETITELTNANEQLAKELHESTVGFLVDLRMAIGKESSRDEAVSKYAARSMESLKDSISDILVEKPVIKPTTRTVEKVEIPAGAEVTESKTLATESVKVISNEDALLSLLSGRRQ